MLDKIIKNKVIKALENIDYGTFDITFPDGKNYVFDSTNGGEKAVVYIKDWRALSSFVRKGDVGLTEAYRDGLWDTPNLVDVLTVGLKNDTAFGDFMYDTLWTKFKNFMMKLCDKNTESGSKKNIHAHYDLGNSFFELWLDKTMTYSAGIFHNDNDTLEQAQHNKYDRILNRFNKKSGSVLEVGCGWGGFSERAVTHGDFGVKGITISNEQYDYAKKRLDNRANIALEDYRKQTGKFDYITSIEMFEAVGQDFWNTYFEKLQSLLAKNGTAMVQSITIGEPYFERYSRCTDMIRTFIFPGGMLPTPTLFTQHAEKAGLQVTDTYKFGQDYATTLSLWLDTFEKRLDAIRALGYDEEFIKVWRFYLAGCIAGFKVERTDVVQFELQHI